ncbi:DUF3891 family protein [Paenibacillus antarcticus]|uniref:Uncharacterized protein n=1 Tax=Paenibacillus antarcticus TaxID=253703 RepID=A0A162QFP7_9BACL|nr:DUF3891 family protein [Paenibacillus antarcticus]OAB48150.1 hypothetical protein PBAT_00470 [Paenibacillus antarcticus]
MICRERKDDWVMFDQHKHGLLAGKFAEALHSARFRISKRWKEALYAVKDHDRGWIYLDDNPFWNDTQDTPYTFMDFPVAVKLTFYSKGLDEIQVNSPYAALLCSLHFERLLVQANFEHPILTKYMEQEQKRRKHIQLELDLIDFTNNSELNYDLHVLKFCDDLSLYLCLNEPGVDKEHEFPWWRDGFAVSEYFDCTEGEIIQAYWKNPTTVELSPFPFDSAFSVELTCRIVSKRDIVKMGITEAYYKTEETHYSFQIQSR